MLYIHIQLPFGRLRLQHFTQTFTEVDEQQHNFATIVTVNLSAAQPNLYRNSLFESLCGLEVFQGLIYLASYSRPDVIQHNLATIVA